jgi:ABC-type branched-subunit amino acid transport system ATPase component
VLKDVSLSIFKGDKVLLIGPNGCGKSTLLKSAIGLVRTKNGNVLLNNTLINRWDTRKRVQKGISYLCQTDNIFPYLNTVENIEMSLIGSSRKTMTQKMEWILSVFPALENKLQKRAGLLSGGERQALAISMALVKESEVLLLDEPTAGLSPKAAQAILEGIKSAYKDTTTMLIVEHNLRHVSQIATKIVGMSQGKIVFENDSVEDTLKDKEAIERIYFG